MRFSILIPTWNNLPELKTCLAALEVQILKDFEVFVCVDGSTDGTLEWLQACRTGFPLKVLQHPGGINRGRAATRNLALEQLQGEFVVFLDSDMRPRPDFLLAHEKALKEKGCISLGSVHYLNRSQNPWARYIGERGIAKFSQGDEVPYHYFITPNTALPAALWQDAGGFDERITGYGGEDMELGYRLMRDFQLRFRYNPAAACDTVQEKTLSEALPQLNTYGREGLPFLVRLHPELLNVYYLKKCVSTRLPDLLFELLTTPVFRAFAWLLYPLSPWALKRQLINYLVIAHIHEGFRQGFQEVL